MAAFGDSPHSVWRIAVAKNPHAVRGELAQWKIVHSPRAQSKINAEALHDLVALTSSRQSPPPPARLVREVIRIKRTTEVYPSGGCPGSS